MYIICKYFECMHSDHKYMAINYQLYIKLETLNKIEK
jgi:hypothetical protein